VNTHAELGCTPQTVDSVAARMTSGRSRQNRVVWSLPLLTFWTYAGTIVLVVLGAAVSLVTTVVVEERKLRATAASDKEQRRRHLRTAARLVRDELIQARNELDEVIHTGQWWSQEVVLATREWDEYRDILADGIDDTVDWYGASAAYHRIRDLNRHRAHLPLTALFDESGDDGLAVEEAREELQTAQMNLGQLAVQAPGRTAPGA
jgi:hypothetical protein